MNIYGKSWWFGPCEAHEDVENMMVEVVRIEA